MEQTIRYRGILIDKKNGKFLTLKKSFDFLSDAKKHIDDVHNDLRLTIKNVDKTKKKLNGTT